MTLAKINENDSIELHSEDEMTLHFGRVSIKLPKDDLFSVAAMFNHSSDKMPDESICAVYKNENGRFLLSYRGITLTMCGGALLKFSELLENGVSSYKELYGAALMESRRNITEILSDIESKIEKLD